MIGGIRENRLTWFRPVEKKNNNKETNNMDEIRAQKEIEEGVGQRKSGWRLCEEDTSAYGVDMIDMV